MASSGAQRSGARLDEEESVHAHATCMEAVELKVVLNQRLGSLSPAEADPGVAAGRLGTHGSTQGLRSGPGRAHDN